jgi:CRP-like cAMP-binding protein
MQLDPSAFVADPELVQALEERATPIDCTADRVLFRQGECAVGLFLLRSGQAMVTMDSNSGQTIVAVQTSAGSLLGLPALVGSQPYSLTAIARAGSDVGFIAREEFDSFMQTSPPLAFKILQVLAAEVSAARRAISI